jgi:predicted permease
MGGYPTQVPIFVENHSVPPGKEPPAVHLDRIDAAYFATMRVHLLRGRNFVDSDDQSSPRVAIINATMASTFWPHEEPLGKFFRAGNETAPPIQIVGIAGNGRYLSLNEPPQPFFYLPLAQDFVSRRTLQIRTSGAPDSFIAPVKEEIDQLAPGLASSDVETMTQSLEGALGFFAFRVTAICASALGLVGLILAMVGVYGIVSFATNQRTREIGIRIAVGATSKDILQMIWKQGARLIVLGLACGVFAAWGLTRTMTHMLVGIRFSDPVTYISVATLLLMIALVACYIPARRAMRVDPMMALRHE